MYYIILSHYEQDILLDESGDKLIELPKGMPSEAHGFKTLEAAKKAHPGKPILSEENYKKHLDKYSALVNRFSKAYTETDDFKMKYKKKFLGGYELINPKKKSFF